MYNNSYNTSLTELYDANNNEIVTNPENYSKVNQIAYVMSHTPGPYTPPNYTPIFIGIFIFVFIILLFGGLMYFSYASTPDTPSKTEKGGYFLLGE